MPTHRLASLLTLAGSLAANAGPPSAELHGPGSDAAPGPAPTGGTPMIGLEFRLLTPEPIAVGDEVHIGLYAVSEVMSGTPSLSAIDMVFVWESSSLMLTGLDPNMALSLAFSGFPVTGSGGLNESDPPLDGDGFYVAFAGFSAPVPATPAGIRITTFVFEALAIDDAASIDILPTGGSPLRTTIVYDGTTPNTDVTGTLTGTSVLICTECLGNTDGDPIVNFTDLNNVLSQFNLTGMGLSADVNCDAVVNFADLNLVLSYYNQPCD